MHVTRLTAAVALALFTGAVRGPRMPRPAPALNATIWLGDIAAGRSRERGYRACSTRGFAA